MWVSFLGTPDCKKYECILDDHRNKPLCCIESGNLRWPTYRLRMHKNISTHTTLTLRRKTQIEVGKCSADKSKNHSEVMAHYHYRRLFCGGSASDLCTTRSTQPTQLADSGPTGTTTESIICKILSSYILYLLHHDKIIFYKS